VLKICAKIARICETDRDGKPAFLVVVDEGWDAEERVIKPVIKLDSSGSLKELVSSIKLQIAELKSLLLLNESESFAKSKIDGPGRIELVTPP
jgi:hypothetical protein